MLEVFPDGANIQHEAHLSEKNGQTQIDIR